MYRPPHGSRGSLNLEATLVIALLVLVASATLLGLGSAIACLYQKEALAVQGLDRAFQRTAGVGVSLDRDGTAVVTWAVSDLPSASYEVRAGSPSDPGYVAEDPSTWPIAVQAGSPPATLAGVAVGSTVAVGVAAGSDCGILAWSVPVVAAVTSPDSYPVAVLSTGASWSDVAVLLPAGFTADFAVPYKLAVTSVVSATNPVARTVVLDMPAAVGHSFDYRQLWGGGTPAAGSGWEGYPAVTAHAYKGTDTAGRHTSESGPWSPAVPPVMANGTPNPAAWSDVAWTPLNSPYSMVGAANGAEAVSSAPMGLGAVARAGATYSATSGPGFAWRASSMSWNNSSFGNYENYGGSTGWSTRGTVPLYSTGTTCTAMVAWVETTTRLMNAQPGSSAFGSPAYIRTVWAGMPVPERRVNYASDTLPRGANYRRQDASTGWSTFWYEPGRVNRQVPDLTWGPGQQQLATGPGSPDSGSFARSDAGATVYRCLAVVTMVQDGANYRVRRRIWAYTDGYYRSLVRNGDDFLQPVASGRGSIDLEIIHGLDMVHYNAADTPALVNLPPQTVFLTTSWTGFWPEPQLAGTGTYHVARTFDPAEVLRLEAANLDGAGWEDFSRDWNR